MPPNGQEVNKNLLITQRNTKALLPLLSLLFAVTRVQQSPPKTSHGKSRAFWQTRDGLFPELSIDVFAVVLQTSTGFRAGSSPSTYTAGAWVAWMNIHTVSPNYVTNAPAFCVRLNEWMDGWMNKWGSEWVKWLRVTFGFVGVNVCKKYPEKENGLSFFFFFGIVSLLSSRHVFSTKLTPTSTSFSGHAGSSLVVEATTEQNVFSEATHNIYSSKKELKFFSVAN